MTTDEGEPIEPVKPKPWQTRVKPRIEIVPHEVGGKLLFTIVLVNHDERRLEDPEMNFHQAKDAIEAARECKEFLKWPIVLTYGSPS